MSAITAKASRKMKKYAVLTREPRCFLGSFDFSWEQRKAKELFVSTADKGYPELPVLSATQDRGMIRRDENSINIFHDKKNEADYKRVLPGQFVIHLRSFQGGFAHSAIEGITSPAYTVFGFSEPEKHDSEYWKYVFTSKSFIRRLETVTYGIRDGRSISYEEFLTLGFLYPSKAEQTAIARYLDKLSDLITLHQRKCALIFSSFQALISMMFTTSTFSWEQRKLSEIADKVTEKNAGLQYVETFTNSAEFGIISQRDFFDHDIAKLGSLDGYYIVKNEDFVYNPRISTSAPVGPINRNKLGRTGVMSPLYTVFRPHDVDTTYLEHFFKCAYWHSFMNFNGDSGARSDRFSIKDDVFFQMPIPLPYIDEQRKIGELLTRLDHLITLHQRECISFTGRAGRLILTANKKRTTSSWEQRKLEDYLTVSVEKNTGNIYGRSDVLSVSGDYGIVNQIEFQGRSFAGASVSNYGVVQTGDVVYTKSPLNSNPYGIIKTNKGKPGIVSTLYAVYHPKENAFSDFIQVYFEQHARMNNYMHPLVNKGAKNDMKVSAENALKGPVCFPSRIEQKSISAFFSVLDHLITLHQRKPFLMKWRTSDANRNQTNRLVL